MTGWPDVTISNWPSLPLNVAVPSSGLPPIGPRQFACSYTQKANSGDTVISYTPCGYTPISKEEDHPAFGKYIKRSMAVDIPLVLLGSYMPKPGDTFIGPDNIHRFNVFKCQSSSIYFSRVVGVCPEISVPLEDTVQYKQASCSGSSTTGARTITFTPIGDPVPAAIQPMTAALGEQFGTKNFEDYFVIYLAVDPSGTGYTIMKAGDLFVDQNAITYEITKVYERDRLDFLAAFEVVKKL